MKPGTNYLQPSAKDYESDHDTYICDCPRCPCAVLVAAEGLWCADCLYNNHCDWNTGERSEK